MRQSSAATCCRSRATSRTPRRWSCSRPPRGYRHDLLLAETDSPFLAPVPLRGRPNSPANVLHTLAFLAGLRGVDAGSLGELIERNAARVFGLP